MNRIVWLLLLTSILFVTAVPPTRQQNAAAKEASHPQPGRNSYADQVWAEEQASKETPEHAGDDYDIEEEEYDQEAEEDYFEDEGDSDEEEEDTDEEDTIDEEEDTNSEPEHQSEIQKLQSLAESSLRDHAKGLAELDGLVNSLKELLERSAELQGRQEKLLSRNGALGELARKVNGIQASQLAKRLNVTYHEELQSRIPSVEASAEEEEIEVEESGASLEELNEKIATDTILKDSTSKLESWTIQLILAEISSIPERMKHRRRASKPKCVTAADAAYIVQEKLVSHGTDSIGIVDHARGSKIVYEMTSETYNRPPGAGETFGTAWWRRFLPEDWEALLPTGWEEWSVAIPSVVYHALGFQGGSTAPVETIFDPNTNPGSCWAMKGQRGRVTLKLPYSLRISAITIDHVSPLLVERSEGSSSAPRWIRVTGFPPCSQQPCRGMGFDVESPKEIISLEYNLTASSIQTFEVPEEEESCGETTSSCSADLSTFEQKPAGSSGNVVAALTVDILDNWGLEDYTCLYRFRVHGDPETDRYS